MLGTDESPFTKVKTLISDLSDRLQAEVPSEMRDTSSHDERMSKATEKENLEADVANMKFDAEEPFMKVKGLVMGLISRLRDESSSQANQKAYCNEEMSKHAPVPQVLEELVEVSTLFSQKRIQHHFGGSFLQGGVGAALRRAVMNSEKVSGSDRSSIPSFLSGGTSDGGRYGPQSGEIVGILKQLMDETSVDLQTLEEEELDQKTNHGSLVKAKTGETLAVEVEKMESEPFEAKRAPFVKVKGLITRLINRLQTEMSHVSHETLMAAEKEDLDADTAKHSSTLVSRSATLDGEISTLQSELSALSNRQLQTDTNAVIRKGFVIGSAALISLVLFGRTPSRVHQSR